MKVAFDSWVLSSRLRCHGTHVYARNLIAQFKSIASRRSDAEFCLFTCAQAHNDANEVHASPGFTLAPSRWLRRDRLWRVAGVNMAARGVGADVLFSPTSNIFPASSVPVVTTIHDATALVAPSHSPPVTAVQRAFLASAIRRSR